MSMYHHIYRQLVVHEKRSDFREKWQTNWILLFSLCYKTNQGGNMSLNLLNLKDLEQGCSCQAHVQKLASLFRTPEIFRLKVGQ